MESSGQGVVGGSIIETVVEQLTSGFLVSPSGAVFTSPFFLLAATLDPQKVRLGKISEGNIGVTGNVNVSSETVVGCGGFGYDNALGSSAYAWVDGDRLDSISGQGVGVKYSYDADGRRVKEVAGGQTRQYLIDRQLPYGQVVLETDGGNDLVAEHVYGLERISQERSGATSWYLADGQGSIRQLTDSAGGVTDTHIYSAFGEDIATTGTTPHDFRYVGEQADPNSGFYYLRARWMDPKVGRFASVDPANPIDDLSVTLNRYTYAELSPISNTDPTGLLVGAGGYSLPGLSLGMAINGILNASARILFSKTMARVFLLLTVAGVASTENDRVDNLYQTNAQFQKDVEANRAFVRNEFEAAQARERKKGGNLLFHYTDQAAAVDIYACQCMFSTPAYSGHPSGAYATDIQPWDPNWTKRKLAGKMYFDPARADRQFSSGRVDYFVAIRDTRDEWSANGGREWVKPGTGVIDINSIFFGKNPMP